MSVRGFALDQRHNALYTVGDYSGVMRQGFRIG
jgi:hypothetical protein